MLVKTLARLNNLSNNFRNLVVKRHYLRNLNSKPNKISYYHGQSDTTLFNQTIAERLDQAADLYANKESHVFFQTNQRLTFKTLKEEAENLATGLISIGFQKGDRIGLWAPNCYEWVVTQFATALIGLIQVNVNPAYKSTELEYALRKVGCKGIIMSEKFRTQNYYEILSSVCPELDKSKPGDLKSKKLPLLKNVIIIGDNHLNGCFSFNDIIKSTDSNFRKEMNVNKQKTESSDPINIQFTSGTTGSPKGVTLTHHMILNNAYLCNIYLGYEKEQNPKILLPLPLYHCFGMVLGSLATICHGLTTVMPSDGFSSEMCLKAIDAEKCTSMYATPTMFVDLINNPNLKKYNISSLNTAIVGGSITPLQVIYDCINVLGCKSAIVGYGMTETSPLITINSVEDTFKNKTETIGKPIEHNEVKIVDKNGKTVPLGTPGEIWVRGYNTMIGYWEDKQKTEETYTPDRFLKTGDLAVMDENGYVRFIGRLKDLIIRGGENIYPREIEEFLHKHPKVADVYVVGVPDKRLIEEMCACVKLVQNETMTADELKSYCKDKISAFKIPRYVEFVDQFPMTVTGKVQKNVLQEIMIKRLGLEK